MGIGRRSARLVLAACTGILGGLSLMLAISASGHDGGSATSSTLATSAGLPVHVEAELSGLDYTRQPTKEYLPCTRPTEPANFTFYSLGPEVAGMPLVAVLRDCDTPGKEGPIRANSVTYVYGVAIGLPCVDTTVDGEGGCSPPLSVTSEPLCEISPADYDFGRDSTNLTLRGTTGASFFGGSRLELYAGETSVAVAGSDPSLVRMAVDALRAEPDSAAPADPISAREQDGDLPAPAPGALTGDLPCTDPTYESGGG